MRYVSLLENISLEAVERFNKISTVLLLFGLASTIFYIGCGPPPPPETPEQKETRLQEFGTENLPTDAKKVVDLGNGWKTFELETNGVKRKFLYRSASKNYGDGQWSQESITEMSLAPLP